MSSFGYGVHPHYHKRVLGCKRIEKAKLPKKVVIPLSHSIGPASEALVAVGDSVKTGQKIADSKKPLGVPIHSSISGKVIEIAEKQTPLGKSSLSIVIESDGKDEWVELKKRSADEISKLSREQLIEIIRESGIVGMGGAMFPTYFKLKGSLEKKVNTIIINGAECEPYITSDHRLMLEHTKEIIQGARILKKALNAKRVVIAVENNKQDAIEQMKKLSDTEIIFSLETSYPQGAEKNLIETITGKEIPMGIFGVERGVVVNNVGTANAVYEAVALGKPLVERIVTVSGSGVKEGKNLKLRIGTSFSDALSQCRGIAKSTVKVISGGPMMGLAQASLDVPIMKGTSGIIVLTKKDVIVEEPLPCIRCSRCIDACPMNLMPNLLANYSEKKRIDLAKENNVLDCVECGACAYVCPSKIRHVQLIKMAKAKLQKK